MERNENFMINKTGEDYTTKVYAFTCDTVDELQYLPKLKSAGLVDPIKSIKSCGHGSNCLILTTGDVAFLNGTTEEGVWEII